MTPNKNIRRGRMKKVTDSDISNIRNPFNGGSRRRGNAINHIDGKSVANTMNIAKLAYR